MKRRFDDPQVLPGTRLSPADCLARAVQLEGSPGEAYVERRGIPCAVAIAAGVRFEADFAGRPAVLAPLHDQSGALTAVHGRYLHNLRGQDKMLTVGHQGGVIRVLQGEPLIIVEGLFDALSVALCGYPAVATIGREVPWLTLARDAFIAFDANRPGNEDADRLLPLLPGSRRLPPPPRCKDWNTALAKRGANGVRRWLRDNLEKP